MTFSADGSVGAAPRPVLDPASIAQRDSSGGKYISLTITITATSREHLDNFYRALTSHPLVKYAL